MHSPLVPEYPNVRLTSERGKHARCPGRRRGLVVWLIALVVLLGQAAAQVQGQDGTPNIIHEIEISGNVQIGKGELLANIASRVGGPLEGRLVTQDIKTLFALGLFQDVRAEAEEVPARGYILRFIVKEKPRIIAVTLSGNVQISDKDLFENMTIQVGSYFAKRLLEESIESIQSTYRTKGYLKVKVIPEVQPESELAYRVNIRIEESPRLYITDIRSSGTKVFSELEIKRLMTSAEVDCFDWITDSGVFDEQKINQDLQIIVSEYLERGYVRVFIEKPKVTLIHNPEFSKIIVELDISEGEQYFTGAMDIAGDILGDKQSLLDQLPLKTGDVYNAILQNRQLFGLRETYQEQGYAFVQVRPDIRINDAARLVDVTYNITKNEKAYIGRIEFQGNSETRDYVMRREFEVQENQLYNGRKLRKSQQNLSALGYFQPSLRIETEPREAQNVLDVVTRVQETQTGTLQAQLGFSDQAGVTVATSVSKGNFLGRGQTFRATLQFSQRIVTQDYSVDFIEPHLFDTEFSSDSSASYRVIEDQTELDRGKFEEISGSQGFGHPIVGPLRINLALSALNRSFEDVDEPAVKLRTFTTAFIYRTVNHPIFPTSGSSITLAVSQIGGQILGGTTEYRRYRLRAQRFYSLNEDNTLILMAKMRLGWLEQVGNNVIPPEERFRLGGINSIRGYRFNEIGGPFGRLERELNSVPRLALDDQGQPILDSSGNPVFIDVDTRILGLDEATLEDVEGGGIFERLFNVELLFPLAGDNFRGVVFYDAGQVNAEKVQYEILNEDEPDFFDLLQSVGAGVRIITPLGVFRFEYGRKLKVREGESPDEFDFTISTLF
ncbi:MAG: outer membrane protein assembly factor BamA [SAR324 cluster bacterium]|nr:outer membrane protein assembly factor BamA [SAR324 cluster bacterium]